MKKHIYLQVGGFTLLELVMVMLIIGIISLMVLPQWPAANLNFEYEARRVLDDVRYTQGLSIASGERYQFVKVTSSTYQIRDEAGTAILLPSGSDTAVLAAGVSFGAFSNLPNDLVMFDSLGVPYITSSYPGTVLSTTAGVTLASGARSHTIQISPETGYGSLT